MRIIPVSEFQRSRWANGRGVTQEIARKDSGGDLIWRLSLADVTADGPFSAFFGLHRILTVVKGAGMRLHATGEVLAAKPLSPVSFSGEVTITGERVDGDVQNLNLIFDPRFVSPEVKVLREQSYTSSGREEAIYCHSGFGVVSGNTIRPGEVALIAEQAVVQTPGVCVLIRLEPAGG